MTIYHTSVKTLYECDLCEKSFGQKSILTNHKKFHGNEKTYECDICKKKFVVI